MSRPYSAALPVAYVVLRILIVLNWLYGAAILALLVAIPNEHYHAALKLTPGPDAERLVMGLRAIAALGLATVPLNHMMLNRLVAMVGTVRAGDPFVAANAYRLQAIAWVLLALQLISMVIGAIAKVVSTAGASAPPRRRLLARRLARRDPHLRPRPGVRRRHADARRPRRDGLTWRSPSSSTTCCTTGG